MLELRLDVCALDTLSVDEEAILFKLLCLILKANSVLISCLIERSFLVISHELPFGTDRPGFFRNGLQGFDVIIL